MYAKIFTSIWDGSLYGKLEASAVMMACVTLCNAEGVLDMTPEAISGRTGWPLEFIKEGIRQLEQPDPRSRTADEEGRRFVRLDQHRDWGWLIVNYEKYRSTKDLDTIREQTNARVAKLRDKKRAVTSGNADVTIGNARLRQAEAEAEAEAEGDKKTPSRRSGVPRGSKRCPPDFQPDLAFAVAELPDLDADREAQKFRDWEFKTPRVDWPACWRTWIRSAKDRGQYSRKPEHREVIRWSA